MAFIEPMHRNKPNITYLNVHNNIAQKAVEVEFWFFLLFFSMDL